MASRVLTGTFAAQDRASVSKEEGEILVLGLVVGVCAKQVVPRTEKSVAKMIFARRIRNSWTKAQEDGKAAPSLRCWIAESPECGCFLPNSRSKWLREWSDVQEPKKERAIRGSVRSR